MQSAPTRDQYGLGVSLEHAHRMVDGELQAACGSGTSKYDGGWHGGVGGWNRRTAVLSLRGAHGDGDSARL